MNRSDELGSAVATLLGELTNGAAAQGGWVLNRGDPGLLASLDRVTPDEASWVPPTGTSSVASHAEHLRYGLSLLNRASAGENPFAEADWSAAWRTTHVSEEEWSRLRADLAEEARKWLDGHQPLLDLGELQLTGVLASAAHMAYHLGAIRQIIPAARGPREQNAAG